MGVARLALGCLLPGSHAATLQVPTNFVVQVAATEPNIQFPMFACLDDRGALLVAESSGLDLYKEISAGTRKCQVRKLEDRDGDGAYETANVFADKLVFPMGLVWRDGKLYIADPPELITLEDTDRDGHADKRTVILSSFGARDNGSLHGLVFGPDGLLYMTIGQPDGYEFKLPNGAVLKGDSGALVRCRADGSQSEILARGFENPVEVVFLPGGEVIGTDNWYQKPAAGLRDALWHLVEGGLYPRHPDNFTRYPITGDPLPALSMFPAVAFSGLARYDGGQFPAEFHGNLFSAKHNSRSVGRHVLHRDGSTFRSDDSDFLTTDDPDFHPSDVLLDRDGSLLVLDTGSWYTDHCPTGKIRESPAKGGIYRVRYKGAEPRSATNDPTRALWAMMRGGVNTNVLLRALNSTDTDRVAAAARIAGTGKVTAVAPQIVPLLSSTNAAVQLAAAEALARCGDVRAVEPLVAALTKPMDRFLEHATIHALHRIVGESIEPLNALLAHDHPRVQKAALLLLAQPPRPATALKAESVLARVQSGDADLRRAALDLLKSRQDWSAHALLVANDWLGRKDLTGEERVGLGALCAAFYGTAAFQDALRAALANGAPAVREFVLPALAIQPAPAKPPQWTSVLRELVHKDSSRERTMAARVIVAWRLGELKSDLSKIAEDASHPAALRLECLRGIVASYELLPEDLFEFLLARLSGDDALSASELLRKAHLTDVQLVQAIQSANALIPPASLLAAFRQSTTAEQTRKLLQAVATMPAAGWNEKEYEAFIMRLPDEFRKEANLTPTRSTRGSRSTNHSCVTVILNVGGLSLRARKWHASLAMPWETAVAKWGPILLAWARSVPGATSWSQFCSRVRPSRRDTSRSRLKQRTAKNSPA